MPQDKMKCCTVIAVAALLMVTGVASAQIHLELMTRLRDPIPPDGSPWHELYPNFCEVHDQENYEDNGDGEVSVCDFVTFGGTRQHITWVGPTYTLVEVTSGDQWHAEPQDPYNPENPFCEIWLEVYPDYGSDWHIDDWQDNGDGVVGPCDIVIIRGGTYHIAEVDLNIITEPASPVEQSTWGRIKSFFGNLL